jgi:hypothetical protein
VSLFDALPEYKVDHQSKLPPEAKHFGQDFGEHSNLNCPWDNAVGFMVNLAAAPAQGQQVERWIPVSERLPEPFTVVALLDENRWMNTGCDDFEANWTGAGWLNNAIATPYWNAIGERRGLTLDSITRWMSLPAAPTKGGDV